MNILSCGFCDLKKYIRKVSNMKRILYLFCIVALSSVLEAKSQTFALKTDLLNWGTASLNIEPEVRIGRRSSLALGVSWNPFTFKETEKNMKWKHLLVQPEYRYWFCNVLEGHFIGLHPFYARFNAGNVNLPFGMWDGLDEHRYQGNLWGAGIGYGYHKIINKRWSFEAEIGFGLGYVDSEKYRCEKCGVKLEDFDKLALMPTKISLSFIYIIK